MAISYSFVAMLRLLVLQWCCWSCVESVGKQPRGHDDDASLVNQLLEQVGLGKGTCKKATELARAALKPPTAALKELAGMSIDNAERSLHNWAKRQAWRRLLPREYDFPIIYANAGNYKTEDEVRFHSALLPHETFASVHGAAPDLFEYLMTGGLDNLKQWWTDAKAADENWYNGHPVVASVPDDGKRVPLGIHGDDAGMAGLESVLCITWGSTAGAQCSTLDTRFAFTM